MYNKIDGVFLSAEVHHHRRPKYWVSNAGVGKSCLLMRFVDDEFKIDSDATIGVEFGSKTIKSHNRVIKLQVWDTVSIERARPARKPTSQSLAPTTGAQSAWSWSTMSPRSPPSNRWGSGCRRRRTWRRTRTSKLCLWAIRTTWGRGMGSII
jgi:hypothetical protein